MLINLLKTLIKGLLFASFFSIVFAFGVTTYLYQLDSFDFENIIYPGVYINNKDFSLSNTNQVKRFFKEKNEKLNWVSMALIYKDQDIATFSGAQLHVKYDTDNIGTRAYSIGRTGNLPQDLLTKLSLVILKQKRYVYNTPTFDLSLVKNYLDNLEKKYDKPAVNAHFEIKNGRVSAFQFEEKGRKIEKEETIVYIKNLLRKPEELNEINIVKIRSTNIEPEVRMNDINDYGIVEIIGEGKSDYSGSSSSRERNIIVASKKLHGVLIPKDSTFSFNKIIGEISSKTGYVQSYIIKGGKTVLGDGGGVCQTSTTLYRTALNSGLPIIERRAHGYRVHYYENDSKPGLDATVYNPTVDFRFKNDTPASILLQTYINRDAKTITYIMYGKKDGRISSISPIRVWGIIAPPEPLYQDDPTLPRGTTKQIDWSAWGAKSSYVYKVIRGNKTLIERTFYSNYRPWQAIYLVGTKD